MSFYFEILISALSWYLASLVSIFKRTWTYNTDNKVYFYDCFIFFLR